MISTKFRFVKFVFSKKATKIDEIFTVDLTACSMCQIDSEDFFKFLAFFENTNFMIFKSEDQTAAELLTIR